MLRERDAARLDGWLELTATSDFRELRRFANGIRRDYAAVQAACELPWSQGPVEGQITRLKLLKRQMVRHVTHNSIALTRSQDEEDDPGVICITLRRKATGKAALQKRG